MEKDSLQLEWESIQDELRNTLPEQPSASVEKYSQSVSQKRLINNNLIELIIAASGVPFLGLLMLSLESNNMEHLGWIKFFAWFTSVIYLYPVIKLFREIHYPDTTLNVTQYLQQLINRMHYYKLYQVVVSFPCSFVIIGMTLFYSKMWAITIDGVYYNKLSELPSDLMWKSIGIIAVITLLMAIFISAMGYVMYIIFYKKRRRELKAKLDILLRKE